MNITDIIALAKQGYKPADIERLLELADKQTGPEQEPQPNPEPETEPQPDDKDAEIEKLRKQIAEANKALEVAQNQNKNVNIAGEGTDDVKVLTDYVKSFM